MQTVKENSADKSTHSFLANRMHRLRHLPDKLHPGSLIVGRKLRTIQGKPVTIPDPELLVHLQFRRFAGCPVCNLHLQSMARRYDEIEKAGTREVVIFHSPAKSLLRHTGDFLFDIVADPQKQLYREFGVESSPSSLYSVNAWWPIIRAVFHSLWMICCFKKPVPPIRPKEGSFGLPADFLIKSDGLVVACKYGTHAYDQWSVEELLEVVHSVRPAITGSKEVRHV